MTLGKYTGTASVKISSKNFSIPFSFAITNASNSPYVLVILFSNLTHVTLPSSVIISAIPVPLYSSNFPFGLDQAFIELADITGNFHYLNGISGNCFRCYPQPIWDPSKVPKIEGEEKEVEATKGRSYTTKPDICRRMNLLWTVITLLYLKSGIPLPSFLRRNSSFSHNFNTFFLLYQMF